MGPLLDTLRERYELCDQQKDLATTGPSMGGMGSLRLAFKYPDRFGAVASLSFTVDDARRCRAAADVVPRLRQHIHVRALDDVGQVLVECDRLRMDRAIGIPVAPQINALSLHARQQLTAVKRHRQQLPRFQVLGFPVPPEAVP